MNFPMQLDNALDWLQATAFAKAISEDEILFPWISGSSAWPHSIARSGG
jgi:hypothetical protein